MRSRGIYDKEERYYACKNSSLRQISSSLTDTVFKLREESKLLRKAHQEVHSQLLSAQVINKGLFMATWGNLSLRSGCTIKTIKYSLNNKSSDQLDSSVVSCLEQCW